MPHPDDNTEWVELYNPTNQAIDLSNWKIKDGNTSTSDDLTLTGQINPLSFISFDHAKGWLNDTGNETITLLDNNAQIMDSYTYSGTIRGKTYGRQPDGLGWIANLDPSKGSSNGEQSTPSPTPTPSPDPTASPTPTPKKTTAPTNAPTASPTYLSTPAPRSTPVPTINKSIRIAAIATATASVTASASSSPKIEIKNQKQTNPFIWVGLVLILMGTSGIGYIYLKNNDKIPVKFRK